MSQLLFGPQEKYNLHGECQLGLLYQQQTFELARPVLVCVESRGVEAILVQNTAPRRFVARRMGASKPLEKLEIG